MVAWSFLTQYAFALGSLITLPLLPDQKAETHRRKREWPKHTGYAVTTVTIIFVALSYALTVNFLAMGESTMCLRIAGGQGCGREPPTQAADC